MRRTLAKCLSGLFIFTSLAPAMPAASAIAFDSKVQEEKLDFKFKDPLQPFVDKAIEAKKQKETEEAARQEQEAAKAKEEEEVASEYGTPHYNPYNLRELSNLSIDQIYQALEGSELQSLAYSYYYYEKYYNVNAIFLMALNSEESGHGRSALAQNYNNLGGVKNGINGWAYFNSWDECLSYIANLIDTDYLNPEGSWYNGVSIWDVNVRYCEGTQWAENLNSIAYELLNKAY